MDTVDVQYLTCDSSFPLTLTVKFLTLTTHNVEGCISHVLNTTLKFLHVIFHEGFRILKVTFTDRTKGFLIAKFVGVGLLRDVEDFTTSKIVIATFDGRFNTLKNTTSRLEVWGEAEV